MKRFAISLCVASALTTGAMGCSPSPVQEPPAAEQQPAAPPADRQAEFGRFPDREFVRLNLDKFQWRPTEGNKLGVETAILEGDPSKPGFYLTINKFPPAVMSRPHYHPDERNVLVVRGTWYTGEGREWAPDRETPLKPGEYMRHPAAGPHYDGARDEETWVAISGYGPTSATVIDGGELFGKLP
jgi:hypothetical protein